VGYHPGHRRLPWRHDDRGASSAAFVAGMGFTFLVFVGLANLITYQYGRGAVRSAVDQAAHAGSRASATEATCQQRARDTLDSLIGGPLGNQVTVTCTDDGDQVRATATATFNGWIELIPDWTFTVTATSTKETAP
jgi:hypothetical protein